jgi:hypothetical protein
MDGTRIEALYATEIPASRGRLGLAPKHPSDATEGSPRQRWGRFKLIRHVLRPPDKGAVSASERGFLELNPPARRRATPLIRGATPIAAPSTALRTGSAPLPPVKGGEIFGQQPGLTTLPSPLRGVLVNFTARRGCSSPCHLSLGALGLCAIHARRRILQCRIMFD